jgi:hypothetical protein
MLILFIMVLGHATAQGVSHQLPTITAYIQFQVRSYEICGQSGMGSVFSKYFNQLLHTHLASGASIVGQLMADVPTGLSLALPHEKKLICTIFFLCILQNFSNCCSSYLLPWHSISVVISHTSSESHT